VHRSLLRLIPFGGLWLLGAAFIVRTALIQPRPSPPEVHRLPPDTAVSVLTALAIMVVETALLATLLLQREGYRSPTRWIVALGPMLALTFYFGFQAMHATNAMFLHVMWLALIDAVLVVGAIVAAIVRGKGRSGR
jgi:hypothetical protein